MCNSSKFFTFLKILKNFQKNLEELAIVASFRAILGYEIARKLETEHTSRLL